MAKVKKLQLIICSLMLVLTGLFFVACGEVDYSKVSVSCLQGESMTLNLSDENVIISFKIENLQKGMSKKLTFSSQGHSISYQPSSPQSDGTTAVAISAVEGGRTILTATSEGQKSCQVIIDVLKPSQSFGNGENVLYVTETKPLMPNSSDFVFDADAHLREVNFYFYGLSQGKNVTLDDVKQEEEFINKFSKVSLAQSVEGDFLVFEENGKYFTVSQSSSARLLPFIEIEKSDEGFVLPLNAYKVKTGDKFTFVAHYAGEVNSQLYAARDFYIYKDIDKTSSSVELKYTNLNATGVEEEISSGKIVIIPNRPEGDSGINYRKVNATFSIEIAEEAKDFIEVDAKFEDEEVANKENLPSYYNNGRLYFPFNITSATNNSLKTNLNVRIYYSNLKNENVGAYFTVPVEIVYQPAQILVSQNNLTFYSHYYDDLTGWQSLSFALDPADAKFDSAVLSFNPDEIQVRYQGQINSTGRLEIEDFTKPVEVRGLRENGQSTMNGSLEIKVSFSVLDSVIETRSANVNYIVKEGASEIENTQFASDEILYMALATDPQNEAGEVQIFDGLVANGDFTTYSIKLERGDDVVEFVALEKNGRTIVLKMKAKAVGYGRYRITLDNGVHQTVDFSVIEELEHLTLEIEEGSSAVKKCSQVEKDKNAFSSEVYILKNNNANVAFKFFANGDKNSSAIEQITEQNRREEGFGIRHNGNSISISTQGNGQGYIILSLFSYKVENFRREQVEYIYTFDIVSYSFLSDFNVNQIQGEEISSASTVSLFSKAPTTKSAQLQIEGGEGYLFYNPIDDVYASEKFDPKFVYFTSSEQAYLNGNPVDRMVFGNVYIIGSGEGYVKFDTTKMTLTPISDGEFEIYATVDQYASVLPRIFPINVKISTYTEVGTISAQNGIDGINFSATESQFQFIVEVNPKNAVNKTIKPVYRPASSTNIFGKDENEINKNIKVSTIDENEGIFLISLDVSSFVYQKQFGENGKEILVDLGGNLFIYPTDWIDENDQLIANDVVPCKIKISYQTGDEVNRFVLETKEDVEAIKNNLSAHYSLATTIDLSGITLPLGKLTGSIVGLNEYAKFTGIEIKTGLPTEGDDTAPAANDYGMFSEVAEWAYIRDIAFEGRFNINDNSTGRRVGIVAGLNSGTLENVGVVLTADATIKANNTSNGLRLGGVVGGNRGTIVQGHLQATQKNEITKSDIKTKITFDSSSFTILINAEDLDLNELGSTSQSTQIAQVRAGGITGRNIGEIVKTSIDDGYGYANYMAYSNFEIIGRTNDIRDYIGGLVGVNNGGSIYAVEKDASGTGDEKTASPIIVGGSLNGYYAVGGATGSVIGSSGTSIKNIISRTFVRGYTNIGAISAMMNVENGGVISGNAVQAVDDGKEGLEASMMVKYSSDTLLPSYQAIAFGEIKGAVSDTPTFSTFVQRELAENEKIESGDRDSYYGDYVHFTGDLASPNIVLQKKFTKDETTLTLSAKEGFSEFDATNLFYMFYFKAQSLNVTSGDENALLKAQLKLDETLNTLMPQDALYPIVSTSNDIIFSTNSNILSIDHSGKITVKGTGTANIIGSSVLNSKLNLTFTILIENYFNHAADISVVYSTLGENTLPVDNGSEVKLKGNNIVNHYIRPNYAFAGENLQANSKGVMSVDGVSITLANNFNLTGESTVTSLTPAVDKALMKVNVTGQNITIKRNENLKENANFSLKIQPYISIGQNKALINKPVTYNIFYTKGAISISSTKYVSASITTGQTLKDTIVVQSTAEEKDPIVKVVDENGNIVSKNIDGSDGLFKVSISEENKTDIASQKFNLSINVNTLSEAYKNRFKENIYGEYRIIIEASSDSNVRLEIPLKYDNVPISNIAIDSYNSMPSENANVVTSSGVAYPGRAGWLEVTISPDTADFDYIIIENSEQNYQNGNGSASFAFLTKDESSFKFELSTITGAVTDRGLKVTLDEILRSYNDTGKEKYHGVIYIRYIISSDSVAEGGQTRFVVTAVKEGGGRAIKEKTLDLVMDHHVYLSVEGKETADRYHPVYDVAKGRMYKLNVDSYGFTDDEIFVTSKDAATATIIKENGEFYVKLASNIDYKNNSNACSVEIEVVGESKDGLRRHSSTMTLQIHEFVLNYNNNIHKNSDVISGMDNGHINIQIGDKKTLEVDLLSFIEYDQTDVEVRNSINTFMSSLRNAAIWQFYSNLENGLPNGQSLKLDKLENGTIFGLDLNLDNYYVSSKDFTFTPKRTHTTLQNYYAFSFSVGYKMTANGLYEADNSSENKIDTVFTFNVYTSSSENHAIPIDGQEALMSMNEGSYYILTSDIVLNSETFSPIDAKFKSLDGNGHTIFFETDFNFGDASNLGLFSQIPSGTIVKNLNIALRKGTRDEETNSTRIKFKTTSTSFNVGLLSAVNNGIITNCHVYSQATENSGYTPFLFVEGGVNARGTVAAVAAINSGYITASRSSLNIMGIYDIAGFVGSNSGKIASSYFRNGVLIGSSSEQNVAGFVINNNQGGQITTSYVSGETDNKYPISTDKLHYIQSTTDQAGFAFVNDGLIENCYSNIRIQGSARMAGFVYTNNGQIDKSFSLSILVNNVTSSAGFAMTADLEASFKDCYYFVGKTHENGAEDFNDNLDDISFEGVESLGYQDFDPKNKEGKFKESFERYIFSSTGENDSVKSSDSVWFIADGVNNELFSTSSLRGGEVVFEDMNVANGRLELVSANILAFSQQEIDYDRTETNEETGDKVYSYKLKSQFGFGTVRNPRIVYDASTFENTMIEHSNSNGVNSEFIRVVADIDYQNFNANSQVYKTIYSSVLEGNGMEIRSINLISTEKLDAAGLFAQVSSKASRPCAVMNLTISPNTVTFAHASSVGVLAGIVNNANIYNVSVSSVGENITVVGNNFVGGVIGRTTNGGNLVDIDSTVSVSANFLPDEDFSYQGMGGENRASYAGGVIGFAGRSNIKRIVSDGDKNILGDRSGLVFGGIGRGAEVSYVYANVSPNSKIKTSRYGGLVTGETGGNLSCVEVYGQGGEVETFDIAPGYLPISVGGVAGLASGGVLSNVVMSQAFSVGAYENGSMFTANYVGGLIGRVQGSAVSISKSIVSGKISASGGVLGGAVASIFEQQLELDQITVQAESLSVSGQVSRQITVGGLVGENEKGFARISNSYCTSDILIDVYSSRTDITANVSGIYASKDNATILNTFSSSSIDAKIEDRAAVGSDFGVLTEPVEQENASIVKVAGNVTCEDVLSSDKVKLSYKSDLRKITLNTYIFAVGKSNITTNRDDEVALYKNENESSKISYLMPAKHEDIYVYEKDGKVILPDLNENGDPDLPDGAKLSFKNDGTEEDPKYSPDKQIEGEDSLKLYKVVSGGGTLPGGTKVSVYTSETLDFIDVYLDARFIKYDGSFVKTENGIRKLDERLIGKYVAYKNGKFDENLYIESAQEREWPYLMFENNLYWLH